MPAKRRSKTTQDVTIQMWLAFVFGVVFILTMLIIALAVPNPTPSSFLTFRVVLALAAAGIAAVIPGFIDVELRWLKIVIRAGGAIAIFVIVYLLKPAALVMK